MQGVLWYFLFKVVKKCCFAFIILIMNFNIIKQSVEKCLQYCYYCTLDVQYEINLYAVYFILLNI